VANAAFPDGQLARRMPAELGPLVTDTALAPCVAAGPSPPADGLDAWAGAIRALNQVGWGAATRRPARHRVAVAAPGGDGLTAGGTGWSAIRRVGARQLVDGTPGRPLVRPGGRRSRAFLDPVGSPREASMTSS
jgi:hypothetical protein